MEVEVEVEVEAVFGGGSSIALTTFGHCIDPNESLNNVRRFNTLVEESATREGGGGVVSVDSEARVIQKHTTRVHELLRGVFYLEANTRSGDTSTRAEAKERLAKV